MNKDKAPKVSIVIIFLNGEKFIQEAIESVLSQTYFNWELLLVDDGSADSSTVIAKKYATQFPERIRYLDHPNHQNLGMSASRNLGFKMANGEYLISMDSDDVLLPDKLERQVAILDNNPGIAMVYGPTLNWYGWTGERKDAVRDQMKEIGVVPEKVYQPPQLMTLYLSDECYFPSTCGMMVCKNIVESIGGWEDGYKNHYEHQVYLAKIVLNYPVYVEGVSGDKYRQHPGMSSLQATYRETYNAHLIYLRWLSQYIVQKGIKNPALNAVLKKALFRRQFKTIIRRILPYGVICCLKRIREFT